MRAILHIGVHKTGSTAIQTCLANNTAALSRKGLFYEPTLPDWPNHNPLADAFYRSRDPVFAEQLLRDLMVRTGDRTLLISSEMLCETQIDADRFLDVLDGWEKTVVAYLRHPCDIVISAFSERVKHYPNRYVRDINELPLAYHPGQIDVLETWLLRDDINLILAPYDPRQWSGGQLFADFLQTIGISSDGLDMSDIRINESLSHTSTDILRRALLGGIVHKDFDLLREALIRFNHRDDQFPLTPDTIAFCGELMRDAIERYRRFLRPGFDERFLFEPRGSK